MESLKQYTNSSCWERWVVTIILAAICALLSAGSLEGQDIRFGRKIPAAVETIYENALSWLANEQGANGSWNTRRGGPGVTGICVMAFLASGEDPNFGRYAPHIRNGIRNIIAKQDRKTGYFGISMYHHGFATLTLAEAYGAVDESLLWQNSSFKADAATADSGNSIAAALDRAIRCAVESQKRNPTGGWRYSPNAIDADSSVVGTVLMGLLACRNAGLNVPDRAIDQALTYLQRSTTSKGFVAYERFIGTLISNGESMNRSAVATLVHAVGKRRDTPQYRATLEYITQRLEHNESRHPDYFLYYMAQALFHGDYQAWEKWNAGIIRKLANQQEDNGSFDNDAYRTAMSLLSLALNHRLLPIYER